MKSLADAAPGSIYFNGGVSFSGSLAAGSQLSLLLCYYRLLRPLL